MIILDITVVSELFRPQPHAGVVAWLEDVTDGVAITAVTLAELLAGVRRVPGGERGTALAMRIDAAVEPYRETTSILPFDDKAAEHYADVLLARERLGLLVRTADAQLAAICRAHGATCATRNGSGFAGTGVELVDPWDSRET